MHETYPLISMEPEIQLAYEERRDNGVEHVWAEMLALQDPPGIVTDDTFLRGKMGGEQFSEKPQTGDFYAKELIAGGGSPQGKVYLSGLARYAGDPEAWVGGRHDVAKVCKHRGWGVSGQVNVKFNQDCIDTNEPGVGLNPKIVDREVARDISEDPGVASTPKKKSEHWKQTFERLKPSYLEKSADVAHLEHLGE